MLPWIGSWVLGPALGLAAVRGGSASQEPPQPAPEPVEAPAAATTSRTQAEPAKPDRAAAPARIDWEPRYHDRAAVRALLEGWSADAAAAGLVAELSELGATHSGLRVAALRLGRSGGSPLRERPTLVLLGGLDGRSLTGSEGVLAVLAHVFAHPDDLPEGVALVAVPWAAPEALERTLAGEPEGRDLRPLDDDGDRLLDEDGPEDLDGDGQILELLVEDPEGAWTRAPDARFLVPAKAGDRVRYRRAPEGKDDDGDGRLNEDPRGGVDLAHAFPFAFAPSGSLATGLSLPLEDEHARSLCALLAECRPLGVLAFQGDHGGLAMVAMETPAERANAELLARAFARNGARAESAPRTLVELGRDGAPGSALAWMRATLGAFVAEFAPWGPEVDHPANGAAPSPASARRDGQDAPFPATPVDPRAELDRAWARWLDDTRGGIGFVDWHPVDLGPGKHALVGGWLAYTRENAPETALAAALASAPASVLRVLAQFPRLEAEFSEARRDGELCFLRARVKNRGALACRAPTASASSAAEGARLETRLVLPAGARLVAGAEAQLLAPLAGGEASRELAWTVLAPPQSVFKLQVSLPWGGTVEQEARP